MRRSFQIWSRTVVLSAVFLGFSVAAQAQSLQETLVRSYGNSPALEASRAQARATDEGIAQALSGYRPTVRATGSIQNSRASLEPFGLTIIRQPKSLAVEAVQPLFAGGGTVSAVRQARARSDAQRFRLQATEQDVLLNAATAHLDVVSNQALVDLANNNVEVLQRQLQAARDRFEVGEITRTDVAQAESRLSGAVANRISAEGQLRVARARYTRAVGEAPVRPLSGPFPFPLPTSLEEALQTAEASNPDLLAAQSLERAARAAIGVETAALLPRLELQGSASRSWEPQFGIRREDEARFLVVLTIPFYEAGLARSQVREARQIASQTRFQFDDAKRQVRAETVAAWRDLESTQAQIVSRRAQVRAAEVAFEGVTQETQVGQRTTLDLLDAEQELFSARANLVVAERNAQVSALNLLSATGQLTAARLKLDTPVYDPSAYTRRAAAKWFGTGIGP
jgi:outer membrane protein/adhesin transport system outer membrane protein